jgi:hypothetical protein
MKNLDEPLFSNTCGKLFNDSIVFASSRHENDISAMQIRKVSLRKSVTWGSLLFSTMPLILFVLPRFVKDSFIQVLMYSLGVLLLAICILMAEKKYTIHIRMSNGSRQKINVSNHNIKDAEKFIGQAMKLIAAKRKETKANALDIKQKEAGYARPVNGTIIPH